MAVSDLLRQQAHIPDPFALNRHGGAPGHGIQESPPEVLHPFQVADAPPPSATPAATPPPTPGIDFGSPDKK